MTSIYESEQYLFEIAQNFMRARVIFTAIELKIFDLLLSYDDGLKCSEIAKELNLYYIENQSRCLQDVLDLLTSMKFLERDNEKLSYKLTNFTRNYLLPNRDILLNIDQDFYRKMSKFNEITLNNSSTDSINQIMLLRIKQLIDLQNQIHGNTNIIVLLFFF